MAMEAQPNFALEIPLPKRYFGKYRGTVFNNIDPLGLYRLQAIVPDVSNIIPTSWAMPCLPVGGMQMGVVTVPPVGAGVWIEFEHGDPDYPVWTGCFWGSIAEIPSTAQLSPSPVPAITLQTPLQNSLIISDNPAVGITLKTASGAMIMVTDAGITISNGKGAIMTMVGPTIDINAGALTIT